MKLETNNIAVGAGLISLDVLIWDGQTIPVSYYVGGTCGNVMMILSHMDWESYPIARLDGTKDGLRVLANVVKYSEQRFKDVKQFDVFADKLFIQTLGAKGLCYRLNSGWVHLDPVANDKVVDTSGAGDWTAAALINELFKDKEVKSISSFSASQIEKALNEAQKVGAKSCSYEGARGMMQEEFKK